MRPPRGAKRSDDAPIVITGGAGFVGCNLAESFLREGHQVILLDNLSRPGVEQNLTWLQENYDDQICPCLADIRNLEAIYPVIEGAKAVFHLASQTAVTISLERPEEDFEVNARGTLNVLEAVRRSGAATPVIFASTNKVYGALSDLEMMELEDRYSPMDPEIFQRGIDETRGLSFSTPYGCSKGTADQYVLDYAASFGIPTAVLRMSCIYGPRQFGTEDQGWIAHFLIRALRGEPLSIYGNGKQVRDVLHVADAVSAYRAVLRQIGTVRGKAYNLGGGPQNAVSLLMVLREISRITGRELVAEWYPWRQGDQRYFVADTSRLQNLVGWEQTIGWREGLGDLAAWFARERGLGLPQPDERLTA